MNKKPCKTCRHDGKDRRDFPCTHCINRTDRGISRHEPSVLSRYVELALTQINNGDVKLAQVTLRESLT